MNKVIKKGKVAVLVSTDFGAGWYSWNTEYPECLYHPGIVSLVEKNVAKEQIEAVAKLLWPNGYWGGARDLEIVWMPEGQQFRINEYDGYESVEYNGDLEWLVA